MYIIFSLKLYFHTLRKTCVAVEAKQRKLMLNELQLLTSVGGIVVSIAAFQAVDPGSIPGRRKFFIFEFAFEFFDLTNFRFRFIYTVYISIRSVHLFLLCLVVEG